MCQLFWALLLSDPCAHGRNMGVCNLLSWILHLAWGPSQQWAAQTEIVLLWVVFLYFLIGLWKSRMCPSELWAYAISYSYFLLNKKILKPFISPHFFPFNFILLGSLFWKYHFQKWCVILANWISGNPKWGVANVHRVLNLCTMVADMVKANYFWTSCTPWPFIFFC